MLKTEWVSGTNFDQQKQGKHLDIVELAGINIYFAHDFFRLPEIILTVALHLDIKSSVYNTNAPLLSGGQALAPHTSIISENTILKTARCYLLVN
jgi:hypothetical protein